MTIRRLPLALLSLSMLSLPLTAGCPGSSTNEPEPTPEVGEPEAQPSVVEPEAQPEAQPSVEPEAEPEGQPEAQPEAQPEPTPEPTPEADPPTTGPDGCELAEAPAAPIRRMTRTEYNMVVRDLLDDFSQPSTGFVPDDRSLGFDNQAAALQVSRLLAEQYQEVNKAVYLAETNVTPMEELAEVDLRKKRAKLKDEIWALLA